MEHQRNKTRPNFKKTERPFGFKGYYVEVPPGGDAVRSYRKIKTTTRSKSPVRSRERNRRNAGRCYAN